MFLHAMLLQKLHIANKNSKTKKGINVNKNGLFFRARGHKKQYEKAAKINNWGDNEKIKYYLCSQVDKDMKEEHNSVFTHKDIREPILHAFRFKSNLKKLKFFLKTYL